MSSSATVGKYRDLIGRLKSHGIQASRRTFVTLDREGPDALLVAEDGRAWLAVIWEGETTHPDLALQKPDNAPPSLDEVARRLLDWHCQQRSKEAEESPEALILAPALNAAEIPENIWHYAGASVRVVAGRVFRKPEWLARALLELPTKPLSPKAIDIWRAITVPEVRIEQPRPRTRRIREDGPRAAPLLLDYKQERCARLDLEPSPSVRALASNLGLRVITGVAGCGKTLLLVHRARLLATHFPTARVLIVSHNRPLIREVQRRVESSISGCPVECRTFYQWLASVAPSPGALMKPREIQRWIGLQRRGGLYPALQRFSDEWLAQEFEWMFSHNQAGDSYLTAVRKGRGISLTVAQRSDVLDLARRYRDHLRAIQASDWSEWPLHILEQNAEALKQPLFDHLLVDEAQFFAPVWLRLLLSVLRPGGHLFLCADPTQGFLRRRMSWNELGLDVRHRSHRLEKPYRSTRAILEFARAFYQRRQPDDDEPLNLPSNECMQTIELGTPPIVQRGGSHQEQITRLMNELHEMRAQGVSLGDVLVVAAGRDQFDKQIVDQLNAQLGAGSAALMKDPHTSEFSTGVVHLMAATGLERPIVFLLGLDDLAAEETNPTLTTEERLGKQLEHTRLIYVGLTRAMSKLVIYTSNVRLRCAMGVESN